VIRAPGPWTHREVSANGARFHVVEMGSGTPIVLLHGFPMFWWTWREYLEPLAHAGFRVIAMDLRGYGGSDHTPHGYDPVTLSNDVAGVIRSLGEPSAFVIGHGWGALIAWSMPTLTPGVVRGVGAVSMPHPRQLRRALFGDGLNRKKSMYAIGFQWPFMPERSLMADDCIRVEQLLRGWSANPEWPTADQALRYRSAFSLWPTAHCAVEYHRWAFRSTLRTDGIRYGKRVATLIDVPVLHIHGSADTSVPAKLSEGNGVWVSGDYEFALIEDAGHFPHEERPEEFREVLMSWLKRHAD